MTDPVGLDVLGRLLPSLAVIVGALLVLRRWSRRGGVTRTGQDVRVLARTGLTRGAVVAVVAVGERRLLVGATDHGVSLLGELDSTDLGPATVDPATGADARGPGQLAELPTLRATDGRALGMHRPRMGLVDRLRAMTVRTHPEGPIRASSR